MESILINIQHEQYLFYFRHMFLLFACSFQSHTTCSSLMSYYWANNKCNIIKGWHWRWLIYALRNFSLRNNILCVFRSNHHCSGKFHKFYRKTPVLESLFSLKMIFSSKDSCSAWASCTSLVLTLSQDLSLLYGLFY